MKSACIILFIGLFFKLVFFTFKFYNSLLTNVSCNPHVCNKSVVRDSGCFTPNNHRALPHNWCSVSISWMSIHHEQRNDEVNCLELTHMYDFVCPLLWNKCSRLLIKKIKNRMGSSRCWANHVLSQLPPPRWVVLLSSWKEGSFSAFSSLPVLTKHGAL